MSDDDSDYRDFRPPLTDDQLLSLQPHIDLLARRLYRKHKPLAAELEVDDLIQHANVALLTRTNWRSALLLARCAMLDYCRHLSRSPTTPVPFGDGEEEFDHADDGVDPLTAASASELGEFRWLELTDRQREAAVLYFAEGLSEAEVGERLGIGQTAVSRLVMKVKAAVREKMETERNGG